MKTRLTALAVAAVALGAFSAPPAEAKFCQTISQQLSQRNAAVEDLDQQFALFATACRAVGNAQTLPNYVLTGASSGIGEAAARRLAAEPGARLVLVARREERLRALAAELGAGHTYVAADLVDDDAPARIRAHVEEHHGGELQLLVNNAGSSWRSTFADGGWENVHRHMALNFDAQVRVTEALLPLLRASAPSAIVNVSSVAGRVGRGGAGAYSASKFALAGWSDALRSEEAEHGVHVGLVLPGFVATEGFPAAELTGKAATRWIVSTPEKAAEAIVDAGLRGKAERYVPRPWFAVAALRALLPGVVRRFSTSSAGRATLTKTGNT